MIKGGLGFQFIMKSLYQGKYDGRVQKSFDETYAELLSRESSDLQYNAKITKFMLKIMDTAKNEINNRNFELAANDIDLLDNLPTSSYSDWDEDYFYYGELLGYIENMHDLKRIDKIKSVIQLIGDLLVDAKL